MALIVCSHLPGEGHFHSERFEVQPVRCDDDFSYWAGLNEAWSTGLTLVNVEHDVEATDEHVQALLDCPRSLCAWSYFCHWASTGLPHDVIAAGTGARDPRTHPDPGYLTGGEEWAAWSAIGLVKITPEARIGPLRREPWQSLELAVHDAVDRPWHMHWGADGPPGVTHHHW